MDILLDVNDYLSIFITLACVTISFAIPLRARNLNLDVFFTSMTFLCISLAVLLENRSAYLFFGSISDKNIAWFASTVLKTSGIWFGLHSLKKFTDLPNDLNRFYMFALVTYVLVFFLGRDGWPQQTVHIMPTVGNHFETIFLTFSLFVNLILCTRMAATLFHVAAQQVSTILRVRVLIGVLATLAAAAFFLSRLILAVFGYFNSESSTVPHIFALSLIFAFLPGIILIPLWYAPNRVVISVLRPLMWLENVFLARDLRFLQDQLAVYCPSLLVWEINWLDILKKPNLYIYQAIIDIFDKKTILSAYLSGLQANDQTLVTNIQNSYRISHWNGNKQKKANDLLRRLNDIDDEAEFLEIAKGYQKLSRSLHGN